MNTQGLLTAIAVTAGCSSHVPIAPAKVGPLPANVGQLRIYSSGQMTFNGAPVSFDALKADLEALNTHSDAIVWYWRENPAGKMPPEVAAVVDRALREVVRLGLPIALSTQPDFSDHMAKAGKFEPGPPPTTRK
jgi:hypothetical protein